jgi:hypothetical protein
VVSNCIISRNSAGGGAGGGAYNGTLVGCLLSSNSANWGGGAYMGTLKNCTLSGNTAGSYGGGVQEATLYNCIVYYNNCGTGPDYYSCTFGYSCTTSDPGGSGNITVAPQFANAAGGDYRLLSNSPCIDKGANAQAAGATDLDGNARIVNGTVDMGAYEYQLTGNGDTDGDGIPDWWETTHGLNPAVSNSPTANADGDGLPDFKEYVCNTDPTNPLSCFRITDAAFSNPALFTVWYQSVTDRFYVLSLCTNLMAPGWTNVPGQGPRSGVGGTDSMNDTNPPANKAFYRVNVTLPP